VSGESLDRLANLRDVAAAAPALRPGVLWRSAQPLAGDAVPDEVEGWPPATVVDLRSAAEVPAGGHPLAAPGTVVRGVELIDHAGDPGALAERRRTLLEVYRAVLEPGTGLVRAVGWVATEPAPVLVHCAAGKDRTGLVVALALRLAGVDRDTVLADFALTTQAMPAVMARLAASSPLPPGADLSTLPPEYFTAPVQALAAVLDDWDTADGGVEGWARAHGAPADLAGTLRRRLVRPPG